MKRMSWLGLLSAVCVNCGPAEDWEAGASVNTSSYEGRTASLSRPLACALDELPALSAIPRLP